MGLVAKAFQDIITFSRATAGTYVNSNGYITNSSVLNYLTYSNAPDNAAWTKSNSFVQTNLLLQSQTFSTTWANGQLLVFGSGSVVDATIAPDGTLTADLIVPNTVNTLHYIQQSVTRTTGLYTRSVYAKSAGYNFIAIQVRDLAGTFKNAEFNISTGAVVASGGAVSTAITSVGNGWYRCSLTYDSGTGATSGNDSFFVGTSAGNWSSGYAGDGVSGVYIWGAQEVQGSVPGNYVATTTAALPVLYADYNGVVRARKVSVDTATTQHRIHQVVTVVASTAYTESVYVKAGEYSKVALREGGFTGSYAAFNLATGTLLDQGSGGVGSITSVGGGWYRISMASASGGVSFRSDVILLEPSYTTGAVTNAYTGDGSSGIYIADAQLNDGSSALAYYDTTASAYNAPRFDYDPVTLAAKGLLIEEQRENLLLQSNDFQTSWSVTNITRTLNQVLSPDGNVNGVKVAATAAAATGLYQQVTATATSHTFSVYVKQGSGATDANSFILRNITTLTNLVQISFDYSTGTVTPITGTGATATAAGNGWWRIVIPATSGITVGNLIAGYACFTGAVETAGEFAYCFGAQLERGAFATSYIPTTTSQFTRAADVASVNTLSPWFNQSGGTIYVEALHGALPNAAALAVEIGDGTNNNRHAVFTSASLAFANYYVFVGGVSQATIGLDTFSANTVGKFAAAYAVNNFRTAGNGTLGGSDVSGSLPANLTTMFIGNNIGSNSFWNGWLRRLTYYPRAFTAAELQSLTTL